MPCRLEKKKVLNRSPRRRHSYSMYASETKNRCPVVVWIREGDKEVHEVTFVRIIGQLMSTLQSDFLLYSIFYIVRIWQWDCVCLLSRCRRLYSCAVCFRCILAPIVYSCAGEFDEVSSVVTEALVEREVQCYSWTAMGKNEMKYSGAITRLIRRLLSLNHVFRSKPSLISRVPFQRASHV